MTYNLTEKQKELAKFLVSAVRTHDFSEEFSMFEDSGHLAFESPDGQRIMCSVLATRRDLNPLIEERLLDCDDNRRSRLKMRARIYDAVDSNFVEATPPPVVATLDNPHPPEITVSLKRLRERFPDDKKVGFLIMRFENSGPYGKIFNTIKSTAKRLGIDVIRADENGFHDNLWENVQTHMHGCSFGIAVYDRITQNEPNANVGLEVGYMMAMNKPVLLLKDDTLQTLQADLAGKLYNPFSPHSPEESIPPQLEQWFRDKGIVVGNS